TQAFRVTPGYPPASTPQGPGEYTRMMSPPANLAPPPPGAPPAATPPGGPMPGMPRMGMPQMGVPQMPHAPQPSMPQQPGMPQMPHMAQPAMPQMAPPQVKIAPVAARVAFAVRPSAAYPSAA